MISCFLKLCQGRLEERDIYNETYDPMSAYHTSLAHLNADHHHEQKEFLVWESEIN